MKSLTVTASDRKRLTRAATRLKKCEEALQLASKTKGFVGGGRIPEDLARWLAPRSAGEADIEVMGWSLVDLMTLALDIATSKVERGTLRSLRAQAIARLIERSKLSTRKETQG